MSYQERSRRLLEDAQIGQRAREARGKRLSAQIAAESLAAMARAATAEAERQQRESDEDQAPQ